LKKFLTFLKILALILICFAIAFLVVWPLWKFALSAPVVYTWVVLILLAAFFVFLIVRKILNKSKK